jgi:DNA helicase-2/ATP-dependent DNA helicase PcrA
LVSYIRAAINPESLSDIKRVINEPKRGIGKVALAKIFAGQANELSGAASNGYRDFQNIINDIRKVAFDKIPSETVRYAIHRSGMFTVYSNGSADEQERLETMEELVTYALRYDDLEIGEGILRMLEDIALLSEQDNMRDDRPAVRLMTVHAAKGLEFDVVCIVGLEEDLFPQRRAGEASNQEREEEERRLFYVALTRAKKKLILSHASFRTIFGTRTVSVPSSYLSDIDERLIAIDTTFLPEPPKHKQKFVFFD